MYHSEISEIFRLIHQYFGGCPAPTWGYQLDPMTWHFLASNHISWQSAINICGG
jgi:hypothetical protein